MLDFVQSALRRLTRLANSCINWWPLLAGVYEKTWKTIWTYMYLTIWVVNRTLYQSNCCSYHQSKNGTASLFVWKRNSLQSQDSTTHCPKHISSNTVLSCRNSDGRVRGSKHKRTWQGFGSFICGLGWWHGILGILPSNNSFQSETPRIPNQQANPPLHHGRKPWVWDPESWDTVHHVHPYAPWCLISQLSTSVGVISKYGCFGWH